MMSKNPEQYGSTKYLAWQAGYNAGALDEAKAAKAKAHDDGITNYDAGVRKGRSLAADGIAESLILLAQEYGSNRFVFTSHNMDELLRVADELNTTVGSIETLR